MKKILQNRGFITIIILGLLKPSGIADLAIYAGGWWKIVSGLLTIFQYAGLLLIALMVIKHRIHISKMTIAVVLFQFFYLVTDLINGVSITKDLAHVVIASGLCLLVEIYADYDLVADLINTVVVIFGIYIVLNFMSIIAFPSGMYRDTVTATGRTENFLLGYKNRHIYYFLPYIGLAPLRDLEKKNCISLRTIVVTFVAVISGFLLDSSTTTVAVLVVSILLLLLRERKFPKLFNPVGMLFGSVLISFILITGVQSGLVNQIAQSLFGKSADFSGRTTIWAAAINLFLRSPIWGNGTTSLISQLSWADISQAHNKYLDLLYVGGVILLLLFIYIFKVLSSRLEKIRDTIQAKAILFAILGYVILFIMESAKTDVVMFFFLMIAYYANTLRLTSNEHHKVKKIILRKR